MRTRIITRHCSHDLRLCPFPPSRFPLDLRRDARPLPYRAVLYRAVHSKNVRGKLQIWVDILTAEESKRYPPVPIADMRPAPCEFEVQVVVWKSVDVKAMDAGNMNDLFARVFMEGHEYQVQQYS